MGIILLPFLVASLCLTGFMLVKLIQYIQKEKEYRVLLFGFLLSCVEIFLLFLFWKSQHKIYVFTPHFNFLSYLIIIPAVFASLISIPNNMVTKKIGILISSNVVITFVLLLFHIFVSSKFIEIFKILGIKTYY